MFFRSPVFLENAREKLIKAIELEISEDEDPAEKVLEESDSVDSSPIDPSPLANSSISQQIMKRIRLEKQHQVISVY